MEIQTLPDGKKQKRKKPEPIRDIIEVILRIEGLNRLNVLVIGEVPGIGWLNLVCPNIYFFKDIERAHGRSRPLSKLKDYSDLLRNRFDLVISDKFFKTCIDSLVWKGVYLTRKDKSSHINGLHYVCDEDGLLIVITNDSDYFDPSEKERRVSNEKLKELLIENIKYLIINHSRGERFYLPDIERVTKIPIEGEVTVTHKGIRACHADMALLNLINSSISVYNPLYTTYTGIIDAYHKFPSTAFRKFTERIDILRDIGFEVKEEEISRSLAERIEKKYSFLSTPLMPLLPQQLIAYFREGEHVAKESEETLGVNKGLTYTIRVGWKKRIEDSVRRGFMTVSVNDKDIYEDDQKGIEGFIKAFGLPHVGSMETLYPEIVGAWRKKARKLFPQLLDFQLDDLSLAATKPSIYLAHDRGLGKTFMSAAWAKLRGYQRVLVATQGMYLDKWESELNKFGLKCQRLLDWREVRELREKIKAGIKNDETTFYLSSFEFLSLKSDIKLDPWTCEERDKSYHLKAIVKEITTERCPSCGKTIGQARNICPNCGADHYNGKYCKECKTPGYSYKRPRPLTPEKCMEIENSFKQGDHRFHSGSFPAYKRLKKLFSAIIIDEAQLVKNKNTLRSTAVRAMHSKGKVLVTANLMKNYPYELFWPVSWLLGFNTPMFPYKYKGGFPFFERQFGTEILKKEKVQKEILERWIKVPEVSNLTILWKLMAPFMVRRLQEDIEELPNKNIEVINLDMDEDHRVLYDKVKNKKLDELSQELVKENPDVRIIGANLWSLRAASTIPIANRYFPFADVSYSGNWEKIEWIEAKVREIRNKGEKVIIFSTMVDMADYVKNRLDKIGVKTLRIKQSTKHRFDEIKRFNKDSTTALVSTIELVGRCFDIESANHVIFTDIGWTPEEHEQAMDRAYRITSTKPLTVYFLLNKETIDEHMFELVIQKGEAIKDVLDKRPHYQPADALREAVQVKVAKRIVSEELKVAKRMVSEKVKPLIPPVTQGYRTPVGPVEQMSLF